MKFICNFGCIEGGNDEFLLNGDGNVVRFGIVEFIGWLFIII